MTAPIVFETRAGFTASALKTKAGFFILVSKFSVGHTDLLLAKHMELKGRVNSQLRIEVNEAKDLEPIDPIALRSLLPAELGSTMTSHIFEVLDRHDKDHHHGDVIMLTSWYYTHLVGWGEASAAKEIALHWEIPVSTIQNRLKLARTRGILKSPGQGSRRGK